MREKRVERENEAKRAQWITETNMVRGRNS